MDELQQLEHVELWQKQLEAHRRNKWFMFELTLYNVCTQCSNTTSMIQWQESLIRAKPGPQIHMAFEKLKMTRPPHRRTILKDWENKWIVATKQQRCPQRHALPTSKYQFFERHGRPRTWSSNVSLLLPWGRFTVLDLLTTKALVLLGFSIMRQWLHHSWILPKSLLRKAATAGLSAGLRTTVRSSASRHIVCGNYGHKVKGKCHIPKPRTYQLVYRQDMQ